jgi:predicted site-specific integrase-resolvase
MGYDTLLTPAQAARIARVSRQLIHRWEQLGHLTRTSGRLRAGDVLEVEAEMRRRSGRPIRTAA